MKTIEQTIRRALKPGNVDWTYQGPHETKKGKVREILQGIPLSGFWSYYHRNKEQVKAAGITLFCHERRQATGEFVTRKGCKIEIRRSSWELTVWINRRNQTALQSLGFEIEPKKDKEMLDIPAERVPF